MVSLSRNKNHRNPIKVCSYKDNTERFACQRMISAILQPLHFKKKSKGENIDPQNIQECYVQYVILKSLFVFIVSLQIGFPNKKYLKESKALLHSCKNLNLGGIISHKRKFILHFTFKVSLVLLFKHHYFLNIPNKIGKTAFQCLKVVLLL